MASSACVLCGLAREKDMYEIKEQAINRLVESSKRRIDNKYKVLQKLTSAFVHRGCQSTYNNERSISTYISSKQRNSTNKKIYIKEALTFDFHTHCLFCGKSFSNCLSKDIRCVTSEDTKRNILQRIKEENKSDDFSKNIAARLKNVHNLIEVKARYHCFCIANFYRSRTSTNVGRPVSETTKNFVDFLINYIHNNENECQFSLNDIKEEFSGDIPDYTIIKKKLKEHFMNDIECHTMKNDIIILYKNGIASKKLCQEWYEKKITNIQDERARIVDMAAKIILEDIRSQLYDLTTYEIPDFNEDNVFKGIPLTLKTFLSIVCSSHKRNIKSSISKTNKKVATLSHCIISTVRPRSFLSPILIGLSSMMHKKYASKGLIDSLSNLGLCSSYKETLRFEASIINDPANHSCSPDSYIQFIYDNADHNTCTIDGKNTFHAMGGIMAVTPSSTVSSKKSISRLKRIPSSEDIGKFGFIELKRFEKKNSEGLKLVLIEDILENNTADYETSSLDFTWLYSKFSDRKSLGWNGFMEKSHSSLNSHASKIIPLPFINNPPSDYDTIFTTLVEASKHCQKQQQKIGFVTFDQPLYQKASEILASIDPQNDPYKLSTIKVRLGGFHLLMSFLGGVGFIMDGSGLKQAFCEIYAENSADKALTGHAYSRAIRGHFLLHLALTELIFSSMNLTDTEKAALDVLLLDIGTEQYARKLQDEDFKQIKQKFIKQIGFLKKRGPTSQLWMQYWEMISIVKDFIRAERSGDWDLHLSTVQRMIPYFHASGHFLYAKSAHLYLQDMRKLKGTINDDYEFTRFTSDGFFTIRRSHKFWSGVWSDMIIEQFLMRSIKTQGGLTHGRGLSESVLTTFVLTMIILVDVCNEMESFCNVSFATTEQHVDSREYRLKRDVADLEKLLSFFNIYDPFPETDKITSIFSGIVGNDTINCHLAYEEGVKSLKTIVGNNFGNVKFQRKKKVRSLKTIQSSLKVNGETVAIDPLLLFQRISLNIHSKEDMEYYLQYELAPFALSLFTEHGLRKNVKAQFYDEFATVDAPSQSNSVVHVVDGGFLLHKVVWQKNDTVEEIVNKYVHYVRNNYAANSSIIFDGYPENENPDTDTAAANWTKQSERVRRKPVENIPEFQYQLHTRIPFTQQKFLSNKRNKDKLIKTLIEKFESEGFSCKQAKEDADVEIINTSIQVFEDTEKIVVVVGQDIDLLVLLNQFHSKKGNIYFHKPGAGNVKDLFYTSNSFKHKSLSSFVALLHCFSGCDTTSAFAGKGKKTTVKSLMTDKKFSTLATIFYKKDADKQDVSKNGFQLIKSIYKCKQENVTLNKLRFHNYQAATIKSSFKLEKLPPTEDAAKQHCYRAYFQLQTWLGNTLDATDWGWKKHQLGVMPKVCEQDLVPEVLLKTIFCKCETGCISKKCSCRKHGLKCTNLCTNCHHAENCCNIEKQIFDSISDSEDVIDEEPYIPGRNIRIEEEDDGVNDDPTDSESVVESDDDEVPAKKQKFISSTSSKFEKTYNCQ